MTVCIAASCDGGKLVVAAADRMFTVGPPLNVEFEPPLSKIETMSQTCIALGAGNGLFTAEILKRARAAVQHSPAATVDQIAVAVKDAYAKYRDDEIESKIVLPTLGPDFIAFKARGGTLPQYLQPQPGIYQQIIVQSNQFNLGVEIIVAGIENEGSHVYYIGNPGILVPFDKIGYNAVGSGATHVAIKFALDCLHPNAPLAETLLAVYAAKKSAEVAPGVGQETEIKVVSSKGIWSAPKDMMDMLAKAHAEGGKKAKPNTEDIKKKYDELRKDT